MTAMHPRHDTHTRGAAALVATVDLQTTVVSVAGVGNCTAAIVGQEHVKRAASLGGILGHDVRFRFANTRIRGAMGPCSSSIVTG